MPLTLYRDARLTVALVPEPTLTPTDSVWLMLPDRPRIVNVAVPAGAVFAAVKVTVVLDVAVVGLNTTVTPGGSPEDENDTVLLKPPVPEIETTVELDPPGAMATAAGAAESVKPGATTTSVIAAFAISLPATPETVTV